MKIEISTSAYEFSHGRRPRGVGCWAFQIGRDTWFAAAEVNGVRTSTMSYSEAAKLARAEAQRRGACRISVAT